MSDHFVVEANSRVVGVAVRVAGGFQFFSSNPAYDHLEGKVYPRVRAVDHLVRQMGERLKRRRIGQPVRQS